MVTKENIFNSKGWKLINKVSSIFSMHHIFRQNYSDLEQLLVKIHNDIFITKEKHNLHYCNRYVKTMKKLITIKTILRSLKMFLIVKKSLMYGVLGEIV